MAITWQGDPWAPTTIYRLGARVVNGAGVYAATQGGISMAGGAGPLGMAQVIPDGTVIWRYVGAASVWTVIGVAPELGTAAAATQVIALAEGDKLDADLFAATLDEAAAYLAAHVATMAKMRGHGAVQSEGEGPFNRSYAMPSAPDALDLALTSYGVRYLELARATPAVFGFVAGQG